MDPSVLDSEGRTPVLESTTPFEELLPSWNVDVPEDAGFVVDLRVAADARAVFSPWLRVGSFGVVPEEAGAGEVTFEGGRVDVDVFRSERAWGAAQLRFTSYGSGSGRAVARRIDVCFSAMRDRVLRADEPGAKAAAGNVRALDVPFRSQRTEGEALASRICSPTSVAMVLEYRGVDRPTREVAALLFDREHDLYGNWNRAVQGAYVLGVPGYLTRIARWSDAEAFVAQGQPLIISIAAREGELRGAPYPQTAGHLLVLTGFDKHGDVLVNDPACADAADGRRTYRRIDLEHVWMERGGTTYVLAAR